MKSKQKEEEMRKVKYAIVALACVMMPVLAVADDDVPTDVLISESPALKGWAVERDIASEFNFEGEMTTIHGDNLAKIVAPDRFDGCTIICVEYEAVARDMEYWIICPGLAGN